MPSHDEPHDDDRNETFTERMDRNWNELLQELRVTQTGTQILTGFLFTIPFQQRFADLDAYQKDLYLVLVVLAVLATALIVAPVSLHRVLFRRRLKPQLVAAADVFARAGLVVLALVLSGGAMLLFDVVSTREIGWLVGGVSLAVLAAAWWLVPRLIARSSRS
ncbi:DUF6328 family protein [Cellulomonas fimi]|uniref:Sodium:proton antiporter n=1 Tax=Cellulomonas fimi (strain ATCC 484 / DSM 20113 / JCM 1341 / CCUG 24087 / LMG 16345 / NBRC 15513 / NCIMB 8980 / NCTC 7547 / NRS-133) TaxID=590998 RepID=F4GZK8_CELFA|nr:DUF6328 family protein [Cellulomonas fimi]AEE46052.1 hypothetical protein Celf_1922 [Cellulomonas fimi ATCC 484]NNH06903.1 sodium:proton antiporter [Cellulomonas fimi]VEH31439.1 Uncharacterised protein [Cellulomonas fimi]